MVKSNRMKGRLKIIKDNIGYKFFKLHSDQGSLKHVLIGSRKHFYKSELDNFKNKIQITS